MKKIIAAILMGLLCFSVLCSCGIDEKPASMEESMDIPEDGIITESVFRSLKEENKVITFKGKNNKTEYEWTVFGKDITEPKDTNLKIEVLEDSADKMIFKLCSEEDFGFSTALSIHSANLWTEDSAQLFFKGQEDKEPVTTVFITGEKSSILNMSILSKGTYVVNPLIKPSDIQKQKESETNTETSKGENQDKTSEADSQKENRSTSSKKETSKTETSKTETSKTETSKTETKEERAVSDGQQTGQDAYLTDPVPEGEPLPAEPENQVVDKSTSLYCTFYIECSTILNNLEWLEESKLDCVPGDGVILYPVTVEFCEGESVFDVLQRICNSYGIHMEASWTPMYNSAYVEGIGNLYEFDCGAGSGWMYRVNGWYPNYGCSRYQLADGDYVEWRYTCDLGVDIGGGYAVGY